MRTTTHTVTDWSAVSRHHRAMQQEIVDWRLKPTCESEESCRLCGPGPCPKTGQTLQQERED